MAASDIDGRLVPIETMQFLAFLFGDYDGAELTMEIRCLPPRGERTDARPPRQWFPLTDNGIETAARNCELWARRWDVYTGVLPRAGRVGTQDAVTAAAWLYADVDGGDGGPQASVSLLAGSHLPKPQMAVVSGGGVHGYWRLASTVDLTEQDAKQAYRAALNRLVLAIGGTSPGTHADPSAAEPARILRVPGTLNHKREPARSVSLLRCKPDQESLSFDEWLHILPPLPSFQAPSCKTSTPAGVTPGLRAWAERGYPEGNRHYDLAGAAAWLVRDLQLPAHEAEELLALKAARSSGTRQITQDELKRIVRWAS